MCLTVCHELVAAEKEALVGKDKGVLSARCERHGIRPEIRRRLQTRHNQLKRRAQCRELERVNGMLQRWDGRFSAGIRVQIVSNLNRFPLQ